MPSTSTETSSRTGARRGRPGYDQATVLRIAVEEFTERGYDATSMGMLAERLGISKSAIYHHVPSKVEILRRALDEALTPLEAVFESPEATTGPAIDRLAHILRSTLRVLFDRRPYVTLLLRLRGNSDVELAALERRRVLDRTVATLVRTAQEEGSIRADVEPGPVARFLFGTVNSLTEWYRPEGRFSEEEAERTMITLFCEGLLPRD
jgi:AcrR family transcriptional regulator